MRLKNIFSTVKACLFLLSFFVIHLGFAQEVRTFNTSGVFTVPDKIDTLLEVRVWGAGGGGGYNPDATARGAGGGGGGGFSLANNLPVTPRSTINYFVGIGGVGGSDSQSAGDGGQSTFGPLVANGGSGVNTGDLRFGAAGGTASGGEINSTGGSGGDSQDIDNSGGGGGGAAGSSIGVGADGNPGNGGVGGGAGGVGVDGSGSGGLGGNAGMDGEGGSAAGGGGGGEGGNAANGGDGADGRIIVSWECFSELTSEEGSDDQIVCIDSPIEDITYVLGGAYGADFSGLPAGVTGTYTDGDILISGSPTEFGIFNYTITAIDACSSITLTGSISVTPPNTFGAISLEIFCEGEELPEGVIQPVTGVVDLGEPVGLPDGITVELISDEIVFSGTPLEPGIFEYSIPLLGGCAEVEATGTLIINSIARIEDPFLEAQTSCDGVPFDPLSVRPGEGFTYQWFVNDEDNNETGTPIDGANDFEFFPPTDVVGEFYYYVVVTSACGTETTVTSPVSEMITVIPGFTVTEGDTTSACFDTEFPDILHFTTEVTDIGTPENIPPGMVVDFDFDEVTGTGTITISGSSPNPGTYNYTIPLIGACGTAEATGTIRVQSATVIFNQNMPAQETCEGTPFEPIRIGALPGLIYQWFENDAPNNTSGTPISDTNSAIFTPPSSEVGTKYYYVRVRSVCTPGVELFSEVSGPQEVKALPDVSFESQPPATDPYCVGEDDFIYSTQAGQSNYEWLFSGEEGTDYSVIAGGTSDDHSITVRWLTPGSKTVSVNYTNADGCSALIPVSSEPLTIQQNSFSPSEPLNPRVCVDTELDPVTINTDLATGIGTPTGLPPGVTATFEDGVITLSGTPTAPGTYEYSIPLTGGCGTVSATGTIEVSPVYQLTSTTSVSPSTVGGTATVTVRGSVSDLPNGTYTVAYILGGANPGGPFTTTFSVSNGRGSFNTVPISDEDLTSLEIQSLSRSNDNCTTIITENNLTFFGICAQVYEVDGFFYVPADIFEITINVWGGGGKGGDATDEVAGGGGGGGGYSTMTIPVNPGQTLRVQVGEGGTVVNPVGGASFVTLSTTDDLAAALIFATGGEAGVTGGAGAGGVGNTQDGQNGFPNDNNIAGGNGGQGGGDGGGLGGAGAIETNNSSAGLAPGGGGGGALGEGNTGSNGGAGMVIISYSCPPISPTDCFEVVDDGSRTGNTIIRFTCEENEWIVPPGLLEFTVVAVGGGGGGGMGTAAGGGGAGGLVSQIFTSSNPEGIADGTSYDILVGRGGAGATTVDERGLNGGASTLTGNLDGEPISISALGGGGGGSFNSDVIRNGNNGASGGGGASSGTGGLGQSGSNGGNGAVGEDAVAGGGGGGAGGAGGNGVASGNETATGGDGGPGSSSSFHGYSFSYGAGGGGIGGASSNNTAGDGGLAPDPMDPMNLVKIGGDGTLGGAGLAGTDGTGSGGGAGTESGGSGGHGVVYIIYQNFNILPVEYIFIKAKYQPDDRKVDVKWATSKEWENSHFEVQRAYQNTKNWENIGRVEGQGYSDGPVHYKFEDKKLPLTGGRVFYRLRQVDFSGKFDDSKVVGVTIPALQFTSGVWRAFPNPTDGEIFKVKLIDRSQYDDEALQYRLLHPMIFTAPITVSSEEEMNAGIEALVRKMPKGVFVVEIQWGSKVEHIKVMKK
ncbi:MAG: glycine-rich domain-containing protein [Cecembia sp.]